MIECFAIPEPHKAYVVFSDPPQRWEFAWYPSGLPVQIGKPRPLSGSPDEYIAELEAMPGLGETHIDLIASVAGRDVLVDRVLILRREQVRALARTPPA